MGVSMGVVPSFSFGVLVGEDDVAFEAVLEGYDLVGLTAVQSRFRLALRSLLRKVELFLRGLFFRDGGGYGWGKRPAFEGIIAKEFREGVLCAVTGKREF